LCLAFAPDEQTVALGGESGTVLLYDVSTGEQCGSFAGHPGRVVALAFTPDGKTLAVASAREVRLWDRQTKKSILLDKHATDVARVRFIEGGRTLVVIGKGAVQAWDV